MRTDLPLAGDASARFLPWIIGCMVYLAALALIAVAATDRLARNWRAELTGTFSVQIPPDSKTVPGDRDSMLRAAVDAIAAMADVSSVRLIDDDAKAGLLEPWLGPGGLPEGVRLPDLIVVQLRADAQADGQAILARIAHLAPDATIESHARWQGDILALARTLKLLAAVIIGLIAAATVVTVIFVTKTGLAIHRRVIEIVHLVGAHDSYIARQFLMHGLRLGLIGGIGGAALAALTLTGLDRLLARTPTTLLPKLTLDASQWLTLGLLPIAVGIVAMVTAHLTVLYALGREP
jgi:cell division transport system permease protein